MQSALYAIKKSGADGVIIWGSSNDLRNVSSCRQFHDYLSDVLGPVVLKLRKNIMLRSEELDGDDFEVDSRNQTIDIDNFNYDALD